MFGINHGLLMLMTPKGDFVEKYHRKKPHERKEFINKAHKAKIGEFKNKRLEKDCEC